MTTTEILRIKNARDTIRTKLVTLGLAENSEKIDSLATIVEAIPDNGAVSATVKEGETYSIPRGYHNGKGEVAGIAGGGNYSLQEKEITPSKGTQTVSSDDGYYGLSKVTVESIPSSYIIPSGTRTITSNGTYNVSNYASAYVNVSSSGSSISTCAVTIRKSMVSAQTTIYYTDGSMVATSTSGSSTSYSVTCAKGTYIIIYANTTTENFTSVSCSGGASLIKNAKLGSYYCAIVSIPANASASATITISNPMGGLD